MTSEDIKSKIADYTQQKEEIATASYEIEIEAKVEAYKETVVAEYEAKRTLKLAKVDNYLDLLGTLYEEEVEREQEVEETAGEEEAETETDTAITAETNKTV